MNRHIFTFSIFYIVSITTYGQDITERNPKVDIQDVSIFTGFYPIQTVNATIADFRLLAPHSQLLKHNTDDYRQSFTYTTSGNSIFCIQMGLHLADDDNESGEKNYIVRAGITYYPGPVLSGSLRKEVYIPYDTLTSSQSGQLIYIDSVYSGSYNMDYNSEQLRLECSMIFSTSRSARWSAFAGAGFTAGLSFDAFTDIFYYETKGTTTRYQGTNANTAGYSSTEAGGSEHFRNKTNSGCSVFIPMGIDFRVARNNVFWRQFHLFYEIRPEIGLTSIPELHSTTEAAIRHGMGIRFSWK